MHRKSRAPSDSELVREGCRSYHKALFAVTRFRFEVQEAIRAAIDERIDDLATALKLNKTEFSEGLWAYASPANVGENWDGSDAEIGLRYPRKDWEAKWCLYFYFWMGDGDDRAESWVGTWFWMKRPGDAMSHLAALEFIGVELDEHHAWLELRIDDATHGLTAALHRLLDKLIDIGRKAGGVTQFLQVP